MRNLSKSILFFKEYLLGKDEGKMKGNEGKGVGGLGWIDTTLTGRHTCR